MHFPLVPIKFMLSHFVPQIAGALVDLHGTLEIINNDATGSDQGAIYVTSFGQMELTRGAALRFINNQGK